MKVCRQVTTGKVVYHRLTTPPQAGTFLCARRSADVASRIALGRRRARKGSLMSESVLTLRVLTRDRYRCRYCGTDLLATFDTFLSAVVDHVRPRSRGGPDHPSNMATACFACDRIKSGRPAETIAEGRAIVARQRALRPAYVAIVATMRKGGVA